MIHRRSGLLAGAAVVLLVAGLWLSMHKSSVQGDLGGGSLFADLGAAVGDVNEVRLSKGDGSRVTLRKEGDGWVVVEREYAADPSRVRELILNLVNMKVVERKTSDPANYARLGVEKPDTPTAASTLLEVVAGAKTWSLIVGKAAEGRAIYVRKPEEAASALASPAITVDPDPKRWLDRQVTDIPGASVHDIAIKPASGPAYLLTRAARDDQDLVLSPVPKGRNPASNMTINGQADALTAFNFDDMRPLPESAPAATDHATFRLFDGQVLEFAGRKGDNKAYVTVTVSRDPALAAKFAPAPAPAPAATPVTPAPDAAALTEPAPAAGEPPTVTPPKPADQTVERLATRAKGIEYEIPLYKYESLFKPQEQLLEAKAGK
jgi:hypothetical protein